MNVDPSNPSLVQVPGKPHTSAYRLKKNRRLSAGSCGPFILILPKRLAETSSFLCKKSLNKF
mgnify:CR=1 FL=1